MASRLLAWIAGVRPAAPVHLWDTGRWSPRRPLPPPAVLAGALIVARRRHASSVQAQPLTRRRRKQPPQLVAVDGRLSDRQPGGGASLQLRPGHLD